MRRVALILAVVLLLAACGGSDDDSSTQTTAAAVDEMSDEAMDDEMSDDEMSDEAMDDEMSDEAMDDMSHDPTTFTVTITNSSEGSDLVTPLSPGAYLVHTAMETLFTEEAADRGEGLEALAEDGDPTSLVETLNGVATVSVADRFNTPDGATDPGPVSPGHSYSFSFDAVPGDYLSFATMFIESNDWFFAPASSGISLFDGDVPIEGDISDLVLLWDAGTEVNETPGEGANQGARQAGPDTGEDEGSVVSAVDGYDGAVKVTITTS